MAKKDIQQGKIAIHTNVSIKSVPSYQVLSLRRTIPDYFAEGQLWGEISAFTQENGIIIANKAFSIYHDADYKEKDVDVELCVPVANIGSNLDGFVYRNTESVPIMAYTMVNGEFKNIAGGISRFCRLVGGA